MNLSGIVNHFLIKVIKPCIIFESSPVYSDNTKPVYDEMVKRGYEKKYHLFWYISNNDYASIDKFGNGIGNIACCGDNFAVYEFGRFFGGMSIYRSGTCAECPHASNL